MSAMLVSSGVRGAVGLGPAPRQAAEAPADQLAIRRERQRDELDHCRRQHVVRQARRQIGANVVDRREFAPACGVQ